MNQIMWYLSWIPVTVGLYILQSWLTVKNNLEDGKWFWIFFVVSLFTPWVIVSKYSKNLVFDALIFDICLVLSYSIGLLYFTNSFSKFSWNQFVGIGLIVFGLFFFKKGI